MTFLLCVVVHATAISKPGFGVMAPLAIGMPEEALCRSMLPPATALTAHSHQQ